MKTDIFHCKQPINKQKTKETEAEKRKKKKKNMHRQQLSLSQWSQDVEVSKRNITTENNQHATQ